jgi:ATP-dependent DNA ligase
VDVWLLPQAVILARAGSTVPPPDALHGGCAYEPKWDGYRALAFITVAGVRSQSRRGADLTDRVPNIAEAASRQLPAGAVSTVRWW